MKARVAVRLKPAILDPQGKSIQRALQQLGYAEVTDVRFGKLIEMTIDGDNITDVRNRVEKMSRELLSNPLMESYDIEIAE